MAFVQRRIRPDDWRPVGVAELEENALTVVKSTDNRSVIAGPGAGKTELLAQRASYLLQTGAVAMPRRILAISFKRDAAANLATRVRKRCHYSQASRFDSLTFDAFAKGIVDRFGQALPERWRPRPNYRIINDKDAKYRRFLDQQSNLMPPSIGGREELEGIAAKEFRKVHLLGSPLPVDGWQQSTPTQWASDRFWSSHILGGSETRLTFPMIGRLAELLLRVNPVVRDALCLSYSHLFMDEFQDTTQVQFDLVRTVFLNSNTVITAVGDYKQQIMRFAMAMSDPFGAYESDFQARRTVLLNNYRSSPELVHIQHVLAQGLDPNSVKPRSKVVRTISGSTCSVCDFSTPQKEAAVLAGFVSKQMNKYDLSPRDFVLLVRQKADEYATVLEPAFRGRNIMLRNEAGKIGGEIMLQELLVEGASRLVISILRLATAPRAGRNWGICRDSLALLRRIGRNDTAGYVRLEQELDLFSTTLGRAHPGPPGNEVDAQEIVGKVSAFLGRSRLAQAYPAYAQGDWLDKVLGATAKHLYSSSSNLQSWGDVLDSYEGLHAVPLMTIHKSKGLEYHTVIFVGLDDSAWWSFKKDPHEGSAGFFVAFSRAKQRVVFTYCEKRGDRREIDALYSLLQEAGVQTRKIG